MSGPPALPMPREIIKWLQSLDLSLSVKHPKRDLSNGYVTAEILSRYYPRDIDLNTFENGNRLAAKVDNWEQIYKVILKKGLPVTKMDIDTVIHCAPDAAVIIAHKLYHGLTKRPMPRSFAVTESEAQPPAYARDTAASRLKDHEVNRIQDNVERTIRAIDTLGMYHEERRSMKAKEAPTLMKHTRRVNTQRPGRDISLAGQDDLQESMQLDEVRVNVRLTGGPSLQAKAGGAEQRNPATAKPVAKKSVPKTAVGALAGMQQPALFVKPAADIMRPLVANIIQESEEVMNCVNTQKDIVISFMENCRDGVPEEISVRVFETLAYRAQILVDTLTKSPPEFWKVWSAFYPALTDFSESSPVFESAVFLFKRIGDLMRESDPTLTQQLITEVGLPSLSKEMIKSPEKRDMLCEIIYSYTQEDTLNHLHVLRALKDRVSSTPVYISCLACLVSIDAQLSLLDEHLLDLYIYYALIAMQSAQPKVRVAGVSILSTITTNSSQHGSIAALVPQFAALAGDDWWEVQAQLLLLSAHLLSKVTSSQDHMDDRAQEDDGGDGGASTHPSEGTAAAHMDDIPEQLLAIIGRLFVVSNSKNVLQVGLTALVHLLPDHPQLLPVFVSVLLEQGPEMRQRLLSPPNSDQENQVARRIYVMGNATKMYEEKCIGDLWPHLDVAKTFAMQLEASPLEKLEPKHMQVLLASLPADFDPLHGEEWVALFEKVQQYIIIALVDPELHLHSTQILKRFWLSPTDFVATRTLECSKRTLLQALVFLYTASEHAKVDEASVLKFLQELHDLGGMVQIEVSSVVETFRETHPAEYDSSRLDTIFG